MFESFFTTKGDYFSSFSKAIKNPKHDGFN
jgi:hypothetical protein